MRDDLTWGDEPFELAKASDCLAVIGLSCGTMVEMVASLMTQIPVEVSCELDLRFCDDIASLKRSILDVLL